MMDEGEGPAMLGSMGAYKKKDKDVISNQIENNKQS